MFRANGLGVKELTANLLTGELEVIGTDYIQSFIEPIGDGWYWFGGSMSLSAILDVRILPVAVGDVFDFCAADARSLADAALNIPPYQRVNTPTDYDTEDFPHYLRPDGVDDSDATGLIDFTGTNKMSVFMGVVKESDAATAVLLELSPTISTNAGSWYISAPQAPAGELVAFYNRGAVDISKSVTTGSPAPASLVLTAQGDLAASTTKLRVNGVDMPTDTAPLGGGNYGNYALYGSRRNNTEFPFKGRIYSRTVRGAASSAGEIRQMEQYIARLMGKAL